MHDLTSRTFGRLTVMGRDPLRRQQSRVYWVCQCSCGKTHSVSTNKLTSGNTQSCGCLAREMHGKPRITHGGTRGPRNTWDPRAKMIYAAKARAKKSGVPFDLQLDDFHIPAMCPVFHFPLNTNTAGSARFDSPSLDRKIPHVGYVKGNVQVISHKANTMKSDASLAELRALVKFMESATEVTGGGHHL